MSNKPIFNSPNITNVNTSTTVSAGSLGTSWAGNLSIQPITWPKPIFIFGTPSSFPPDYLDHISKILEEKLLEYHVIVIPNITDTYSAKLFALQGEDEVDLSSIEKYIKSKL